MWVSEVVDFLYDFFLDLWPCSCGTIVVASRHFRGLPLKLRMKLNVNSMRTTERTREMSSIGSDSSSLCCL